MGTTVRIFMNAENISLYNQKEGYSRSFTHLAAQSFHLLLLHLQDVMPRILKNACGSFCRMCKRADQHCAMMGLSNYHWWLYWPDFTVSLETEETCWTQLAAIQIRLTFQEPRFLWNQVYCAGIDIGFNTVSIWNLETYSQNAKKSESSLLLSAPPLNPPVKLIVTRLNFLIFDIVFLSLALSRRYSLQSALYSSEGYPEP